MNFVSFSPHYPPNYYPFCVHLRKMGVNVLGLADAPYDELNPELKSALAEYYRVSNAQNYDELYRSLGYFAHRYGRLDRLESHNEFWLESDARLRTDFNIPGLHTSDMKKIKRKSEMKKVYSQAGITAPRGKVLHTFWKAKAFIDEVGYPVVAKPDIGVGASKTYKIQNQAELEAFFSDKPAEDFIFEEFIQAGIHTFDGLTDQDGKIVFCSSLTYSEGLMDSVNQKNDVLFYSERKIPQDLEEAGNRLVEVYNLKERFFHFEFFRTEEGKLIGLEVNMRPPGGRILDMWNYANDMDIYREYANIVVNNRFDAVVTRPYHCGYVGRRLNRSYLHSHEEVLAALPGYIVHTEAVSGVLTPAMGDQSYLVRSPDLGELYEIVSWILEK